MPQLCFSVFRCNISFANFSHENGSLSQNLHTNWIFSCQEMSFVHGHMILLAVSQCRCIPAVFLFKSLNQNEALSMNAIWQILFRKSLPHIDWWFVSLLHCSIGLKMWIFILLQTQFEGRYEEISSTQSINMTAKWSRATLFSMPQVYTPSCI